MGGHICISKKVYKFDNFFTMFTENIQTMFKQYGMPIGIEWHFYAITITN